MLSVPIQKDIGEYEEKIVGGLTIRTFIALVIGCALGAAEGLVGHYLMHIDIDSLSIFIFVTVMAAFAAGYVKPLDMPMKDALPFLIRQNLTGMPLKYRSSLGLALVDLGKEQDKERKADKNVSKAQKEERDRYLDDLDRAAKSGPVERIICEYARAELEGLEHAESRAAGRPR
jgi:hypothetical protein